MGDSYYDCGPVCGTSVTTTPTNAKFPDPWQNYAAQAFAVGVNSTVGIPLNCHTVIIHNTSTDTALLCNTDMSLIPTPFAAGPTLNGRINTFTVVAGGTLTMGLGNPAVVPNSQPGGTYPALTPNNSAYGIIYDSVTNPVTANIIYLCSISVPPT